MFESRQEPLPQESSLANDLITFYDEFAEFNDYCAFLCAAFASIVANEEIIDERSAQGFGRCSHWMSYRMEELKKKLKKIQERSRAEAKC